MINPNVKQISEPPIPEAISWSDNYNGKFGKIIDMSQAVPSYPPHSELLKNFKHFASDNALLSYGDIEGEKILRKNYSDHLNKKYNAKTDFEQILITSGCNQAFISSIICLAESGDEIMISDPGYFSHKLTLDMLNIKSNFFNLKKRKNFEIDLKDLEEKINPKVKAIVVVSPGNPTGSIQNTNILNELFELCIYYNKFLIIDETYRDFIYPKKTAPHELFSFKNWNKHLIQLYSFSKSLCIPGHRLGAITADKSIINEISKVMDNMQICAPRPAQYAVAHYLPKIDKFINKKSSDIAEKALLFTKVLSTCPEWEIASIGTFFVYVKHPFENLECDKVSQILAKELGIITIPGKYFGRNQEKFIRMSIAGLTKDEIIEVPNRLVNLQNIDV